MEKEANAAFGTARLTRTDERTSPKDCSEPRPTCSDASSTRTSREQTEFEEMGWSLKEVGIGHHKGTVSIVEFVEECAFKNA